MAPSSSACVCGNVFFADSDYCRRCGTKRPALGEVGDSTLLPSQVSLTRLSQEKNRDVSPASNKLRKILTLEEHNSLLHGTTRSRPQSAAVGNRPWTASADMSADRAGMADRKHNAALHDRCLSKLGELRCLETELDLTFQSLKALSTSRRPQSLTTISALPAEESEVALFFEWKPRRGKSQGLSLRSPWACKVIARAGQGPFNPVCSRPTTPVRCPSPGRISSDGMHTLQMDLRENIVEKVVLSRPRGFDNDPVVCPPPLPKQALGNEAFFDQDSESFGFIETQCGSLIRTLGQKLLEHVGGVLPHHSDQSSPLELRASRLGMAATEEVSRDANRISSGTTTGKRSAIAAAAMAASSRERSRERMSEYLRDVRIALRVLGPALPIASCLLEGAVKGLVLAFDEELTAALRSVTNLEARCAKRKADVFEKDTLLRQLREMTERNLDLQDRIGDAQIKNADKTRHMQEQVNDLMEQIHRLTPNKEDLQGLTGLVKEIATMMDDMETESGRQNKILNEMKTYTLNVIRDSGRDPMKNRSMTGGRIVELTTGEIQLRPYDVVDRGTQVSDANLLLAETSSPIRLRMPRARLILGSLEGQEVPTATCEELCTLIDKIYMSKIAADVEADAARVPRSELLDFMVEDNLEFSEYGGEAERKLCSVLHYLVAAEERSEKPPPKIALFSRFLEFCDYEQALPLSILNVALHAKRLAQHSLKSKEQALGPRGEQPHVAKKKMNRSKSISGAFPCADPTAELYIGVAQAYSIAEALVPPSGSGAGSAGLAELFNALARSCEVEELLSEAPPRENRALAVLVALLTDRLQQERAPALQHLVHAAKDGSGTIIPAEKFRDAVLDAHLRSIDEAVWRSSVTSTAERLAPGSDDHGVGMFILEHFAQAARPARVAVSETAFLEAVASAVSAEAAERIKPLQQALKYDEDGLLPFAEWDRAAKALDPHLSAPAVRRCYSTAFEASRACSQVPGIKCSSAGTLVGHKGHNGFASAAYGGDIVTFKLLSYAALRHRIFLKDLPPTGAEETARVLLAALPPLHHNVFSPASSGRGHAPDPKKVKKK